MKQLSSKEIRNLYLNYFKQKKHAIIASAPVIPENDPTVLFNTAGMQPLVPYLLGEKHPCGKRIANFQKCIRTIDLDEVGDDSHLTFFEMLGNWSLGDYFKKDAIAWSFEFLTSPDWLGIEKEYIAITVFEGDKDASRDDESAKYWLSHGISKDRISFMPKKDNWWGPAGLTGPCGPDTEMFYWVGKGKPSSDSNVKNDSLNWMEIWNDVFMEFIKNEKGDYLKASKQNVDTGMGLERVTTVLNGKKSVYDTDIFKEIINKIEEVTGKEYKEGVIINKMNFDNDDDLIQTVKHMRIISDHARTATIMISDGITPSNVDQGYILRRLIRRSIRSANKLGVDKSFMSEIAKIVIKKFENIYSSIMNNKKKIIDEINLEEERFRKTLNAGLREFNKLIKGFEIAFERTGKKITKISGDKAFKLYDTYGFPIEMTIELAKEKHFEVDVEGFKKSFKEHQEKSRVSSAKKFSGGLADDSEKTKALHTATHLLHAALRKVLGNHVKQSGSNITAERLRFDFSHPEKVTPKQLKEVEDIVNNIIEKDIPVSVNEMTVEEAKDSGAIGLFGDKYGERVKVYTVLGFSKEICGGPHVDSTGKLGKFKIQKEQASSAGIRRIRAVLI